MTGLMRSVLLAGSRNNWLRARAARYPFVRRSVSRFMPGEHLDDAITASRTLEAAGTMVLLTRLGENVTTDAAAEEVAAHYLGVIDRISADRVRAHISVKLTQLGLDLSIDACERRLRTLTQRAASSAIVVWVDMESSSYVDRTIATFRRVRSELPNIGICLQAYLRRTAADLLFRRSPSHTPPPDLEDGAAAGDGRRRGGEAPPMDAAALIG